jgi:ubiquinone/menaquinone biosynthesis C-methylase UbiE
MRSRSPAVGNFDHIARPYRWLEYLTFGRSLQGCRTRFLPQLAGRSSALVLGDGDGRFLARLLAANPQLHVDAVDASGTMLHLLQRRAASAANAPSGLHTHHTDALTFAPSRTYDLIVTHFFLDCLTGADIHTLCSRLVPHLDPGTLWLVSEFQVPTGAMHWPARSIVRLLYFAFRMLTQLRTSRLPDHALALASAGFLPVARHHALGGLLTSELWAYTPAMLPPQRSRIPHVPDPVSDPEPAPPSLPEPDPAVFHHDPATAVPSPPSETERPPD